VTSTLWFRVRAEAADVIAEASRDGQAWQQLRIAPLLERRVTASINKGRAAVRRGLSLASGTTMLAWREASEAASRNAPTQAFAVCARKSPRGVNLTFTPGLGASPTHQQRR